jgi:chitinase
LAGEDYWPASGTLVFLPGEYSKVISVPLATDAPGDEGEDFFVELFDAAGAAIRNGWWRFVIREGGVPPRVRLSQTLFELVEGSGSFPIDIELSSPLSQIVDAFWEVRDQTAFYSADFSGPYSSSFPWRQVRFWPGQTSGTIQFRILDDEIPEEEEGFRLLPMWDVVNALPGVPQYGYVRILDDDGAAP